MKWKATAHKAPHGWLVELRTNDGALIYLHRSVARELGNQLRGAADQCDCEDATNTRRTETAK